jgi:Protein of unknown function (DUF2034)
VQCKALAAKVGPNIVRELEGAFAGAPAGWEGADVVGILCARREASKGVRDTVRRSGRGLIWVMVDDQVAHGGEADDEARIRQVVWNQRIADLCAEGLGVGIVYGGEKGDAHGLQGEVRLMWKGNIWQPEFGKTSP